MKQIILGIAILLFVASVAHGQVASPRVWEYGATSRLPAEMGDSGAGVRAQNVAYGQSANPQTSDSLKAIPKQAPKFLVVYRVVGSVRVPRFEEAWVYKYAGFADMASVMDFLEKNDITDEQLIGVYEVGKQVPIVPTETVEPVAPKKVLKWKKP